MAIFAMVGPAIGDRKNGDGDLPDDDPAIGDRELDGLYMSLTAAEKYVTLT